MTEEQLEQLNALKIECEQCRMEVKIANNGLKDFNDESRKSTHRWFTVDLYRFDQAKARAFLAENLSDKEQELHDAEARYSKALERFKEVSND